MFKNILQDITRVDVWPMMALLIFVAFFVGVVLFAFTRRPAYLHDLSALPLDDDNPAKDTDHE